MLIQAALDCEDGLWAQNFNSLYVASAREMRRAVLGRGKKMRKGSVILLEDSPNLKRVL